MALNQLKMTATPGQAAARLLILGALLVLGACGGRDTVITQDDSAEYRNARVLPPLKKPARQTNSPAATPADISTEPSAAPTSTAPTPAQPAAQAPIEARVVDEGSEHARLEIGAGFETAWDFVSSNLAGSDLTVHARNRVAGRFSVGCASMQVETEVTRKGGWSIFRRKPSEENEHCVLQVVTSKDTSVVSILNRSGEEIAAESARQVFARLLNNE